MRAMRGYERDEYEDWDQQGGTHQSTEESGYLALRQKLKESIRKQMKKDLGTANSGSIGKTNTFRKDNYGSFFGPSQPVIAQRVIEESKSLLENPELAARIAKKTNKPTVSAPVRLKSQASHRPSVTNGLKRKVEMIKNTRDYSFLLSDDAEVPASKSPQPRSVSAPNSDARSAQLLSRSTPVPNNHGREPSIRDGRKQIPASSQSKPKIGQEKLGHTGKSSLESRKHLSSSTGSGPGRPMEPKGLPRKSVLPATRKMSQPLAKKMMSDDRKPPSSSIQVAAHKPTHSNIKSGIHKSTPSHGQPPTHSNRSLSQKECQQISKPKVISKQALSSSRVQLKRSPPKAPHRAPLRDERPKAKPKRQLNDEDSDGENAINMIRKMFGYNPNKFRDDDDDDSDMEANFDDIMREEKRSAKIARKEDEEQLRIIEEEERRERERLAKKRKLVR